MISQAISYKNAQDKQVLIILEPWAEQYWVKPGMTVEIIGTGGEGPAKFEVQQTNEGLIVFGWVDSVVVIMHDGHELSPADQD